MKIEKWKDLSEVRLMASPLLLAVRLRREHSLTMRAERGRRGGDALAKRDREKERSRGNEVMGAAGGTLRERRRRDADAGKCRPSRSPR